MTNKESGLLDEGKIFPIVKDLARLVISGNLTRAKVLPAVTKAIRALNALLPLEETPVVKGSGDPEQPQRVEP